MPEIQKNSGIWIVFQLAIRIGFNFPDRRKHGTLRLCFFMLIKVVVKNSDASIDYSSKASPSFTFPACAFGLHTKQWQCNESMLLCIICK